jgi:c-di-AMP phosphodiesterase-like protein
MRLYFIILVVFAVITYFFEAGNHLLAVVEGGLILLLALYTHVDSRRRMARMSKYIASVTDDVGNATRDTLWNMPLPVVMFYLGSGDILWANESWRSMTSDREHMFEVGVNDVVPGFDTSWIAQGESESPSVVAVGDRRFKVYGTLLRDDRETIRSALTATTYWVDVTEYDRTSEEYRKTRPATAIIAIDNYEDLLKNLSERDKSSILSDIDTALTAWTAEIGGFLRRYDRDRYLLILQEQNAEKLSRDKFSVLEAVRRITGAGGARASLSIGVGRDETTVEDNVRVANLALEMALARGGDQAVIKNRLNFEFFGGDAAAPERRSKVRSRVMANALGELIDSCSQVLITGHHNGDYDCYGAAAGIYRTASARGKKAYIVVDEVRTMGQKLIDHLRRDDDYDRAFLTPSEAMVIADAETLLVVVDTSRPEETELPGLLESCTRIAVIDHHRRAATFIDNPTLNYNEPYASSACELVTEMMQYLVEQSDIRKSDADALLSGIVLDTKTFTIHTGSRTFDAAAYLRRCGADMADVKSMMQSDYVTAMQRYNIVRLAKVYKHDIAIAVSDRDEARVVIAQAADELLSISGITCSFVMSVCGGEIAVSGRSIGHRNVQLVLEKLGGGGNQSIAAASIKDITIEEASRRLIHAIDEYLEENDDEQLTVNN